MALNKNHEFEELDGVKCGIVEKNVKSQRVSFLKELLELNRYEVVVIPTPAAKPVPPKPVPPKTIIEGEPVIAPPVEAPLTPPPPPPPDTFTIGVSDITFNPINAIFGRMLKTKDGHIVTLAYWQQKDDISHDEIPYFESL